MSPIAQEKCSEMAASSESHNTATFLPIIVAGFALVKFYNDSLRRVGLPPRNEISY